MQNPEEDKPQTGEQAPGALDETAPLMASKIPEDAQETSLDINAEPSGFISDETIPLAPTIQAQDADAFSETIPFIPVEPSETLTQTDQPPSNAFLPKNGKKKPPRRSSFIPITLLGILGLMVIAAISAFGGYHSGISLRKSAEATQVSSRIQEQFELGLQDMADKQYFRARQRFEYVIQLDPNYPGVTEKLAEVLLELNTTATPTIAPTPSLTPTPDLRGVEELFSQAQQALYNGEWTTAIDTALQLRKNDPQFHAVDVDGILYLALRNRGRDKIVKEGDLEGGMYDLGLAERFGPLDNEAQGLLTWSRLYITGASFWEIDWKQAVQYFEQVAPQLPNLRDGSGMTAQERYRIALIGYGDYLASRGEWCDALAQYELSLSLGYSAEAENGYTEAAKNCGGGGEEQPNPEVPPEAAPVEQPTQDPNQFILP